MADIYGRMKQVERKLDWMMHCITMQAAMSSGLTGPDGQPLPPRMIRGTMAELYELAKQATTITEDDQDLSLVKAAGDQNG